MGSPQEDRPRPRWILILLVWTVPALVSGSQLYLRRVSQTGEGSWGSVVAFQLPVWYIWAVLTPPILWLARRVPFERGQWTRALAVHVPVSLFGVGLYLFLYSLLFLAQGATPLTAGALWATYKSFLLNFFQWVLVTYWAILGVGHALNFQRKYQREELEASRQALRASELEGRLAQAQLQALKNQLHPHFLFNSLHAVAGLVRQGQRKEAVDMLAGLSDLLRMALENVGAQETTLHVELEFLRKYLEIEQVRFGERLKTSIEVPSETLDARVPNLILQPLAENAVRHGLAASSQARLLEVRVERRAGRLHLEVYNEGPPLGPRPETAGPGMGLTTTRERLRQLYGDDHSFDLVDVKGKGVAARLSLPFRLWEDPV